MGCGAETEANSVMTTLIAGENFTIPAIDLTGNEFDVPVTAIVLPDVITNALLTTKTSAVAGTGTFDIIMISLKAHLKEEYDAGRITGAEYAKAYIELTTAALTNATQFLLQKDQAYWQGVTAQYQARIAEAQIVKTRLEVETAKLQVSVVQLQALTQKSEFALTKMKLSTESINYCAQKYNVDNILPAQKLALDDAHAQSAYQLANILPAQKLQINENAEAARAQTLNTRSDGVTTVVGVLGKQKELYAQQITSYQRDSEVKTAKLFTDAWITMKSIDEGLLPPTNFNNTSIDAILLDLKTNNNIG